MDQVDDNCDTWQRLAVVSYAVDRSPLGGPRCAPLQRHATRGPSKDFHSPALQRTVAPHGMTSPEIERLSGAMRYMELHCQPRRARLWLLTTNKKTMRSVIADIWKRITRLQAKHGVPPYSATTFEARGGLHAHIIFIGTSEIVRRLRSSRVFGAIVDIQLVTDPGGLACSYLAKERTPQAGYRRWHILGGRLRGSHRLSGGGDRVRLSRKLESDAIGAKYVVPWQHTNARRSLNHKTRRLSLSDESAG